VIQLLVQVKARRQKWQLSYRRKNLLTLSYLAVTEKVLFDLVYHKLSYRNYLAGPMPDNHVSVIPGNIWLFAMVIEHQTYYLKFQDRPSGMIMWISIHVAEWPVRYPFKD